jgi:hypothetical protein
MTELETKIETEDFADELSDEALDREESLGERGCWSQTCGG